MDYFISGNDKYYSIEYLEEFVAKCTKDNIAIISIDFFCVNEKIIKPFAKITSFDGSSLYNTKDTHLVNVKRCNSFISDTLNKCFSELKGLYFSAILQEGEV